MAHLLRSFTLRSAPLRTAFQIAYRQPLPVRMMATKSYQEPQPLFMRIMTGVTAVGLLGGISYGAYELVMPQSKLDDFLDFKGRNIQLQQFDNEWSFEAMKHRASTRLSQFIKYFADPIDDKLLPDELPPPYQRPYTLVIDLNKVLVHSDWSIDRGWRTMVRPGAPYFLAYLSNYYEIVIFSQEPFTYAEPIISKMDPHGYVMYRLYRDATKYEDGKHVKDISRLNRDLRKVIVIDDEPENLKYQPENLITAKPWTDDPHDNWLTQLIPFLETLAMSNANDVRPILKSYEGRDIAEAFAENQRRYLAQKAALQQQQPQKKKGLGSLFGSAPEQPVDLESQAALNRQMFEKQQEEVLRQVAEQPPPPPQQQPSLIGSLIFGRKDEPPKPEEQK